jgi:hypothetical protein
MKKILLSIVMGVTVSSFSQMLYDQTTNDNGSGIVSNYYTDLDTVVTSADDFTVIAGDIWDVTSVTVHGFRNGAGADMTSVEVEIFSDDSGKPGTSIYVETFTVAIPCPQMDTALVFAIPMLNLTEGTYWLAATGYAEGSGRWNWAAVDGSNGAGAMLIDVDDYFGAGATDWTALTALGLSFSELRFAIDGNRSVVGVEENELEDLTIFPNPVLDVLTLNNVDLNEVESINIFNIGGQLVDAMPISNTLYLSHLAVGSYLVEVKTENTVIRKQFVKK